MGILKFLAVRTKIIKEMKRHGLMVTVTENSCTRWIYHKGRFYSRDKPNGMTFLRMWHKVTADNGFELYVFVEAQVVVDVNGDRVLFIS